MKRIRLFLQLCFILSIIALSSSCSRSSNAAYSLPPIAAPNHPQHVALLLPLSGPLAPYANAIRNGFFTAYYHQKNETGYAPSITVYDTTGKNILSLYQSAIANGTQFIVGPLDKTDVATLASQSTSTVPVLALNTTPQHHRIENNALIEFGLSPINEAQEAAQKAYQDNRRRMIIIAPNTEWGKRSADAFTAQWNQLGGTVIATQYYDGMRTISKNIQTVLQISNAYQDQHQIERMVGKTIRFVPQRRHDFDSIFLVATPAMARQIELLLRFYFADNIPIYATSQIYNSTANAAENADLDGIQFCDMPWILSPTPAQLATQQRIQTLWPKNYNALSQFYAMGIDAYQIMTQLNRMQSNTQQGIPGATGTLYLTQQHVIYRRLVWAQFKNGTPQRLS